MKLKEYKSNVTCKPVMKIINNGGNSALTEEVMKNGNYTTMADELDSRDNREVAVTDMKRSFSLIILHPGTM